MKAESPVNPTTIARPVYEGGFENCIRATDKELPKTDCNSESIKIQLPQQPSGTREKNEKNELIAVVVQE